MIKGGKNGVQHLSMFFLKLNSSLNKHLKPSMNKAILFKNINTDIGISKS